MRLVALVALLSLDLLAWAQEAPQGYSPASIDPAARCYVDAVNAEDLEALIACFSFDGLVVDVAREIRGREAIRTWAEREVMGESSK